MSFEDALLNGVVAAATAGVFGALPDGLSTAERIFTHGAVGAAAAGARGDDPAIGFVTSFASKSLSLEFGAQLESIENTVVESLIMGLVGGAISEAAGGKFANGAITAAVAYAYNQLARRERREAYQEFNRTVDQAFSGTNAPGQRWFDSETEAAFAWGDIAQPVTNKFQKYQWEIGTYILRDGNQFTYAEPVVSPMDRTFVKITLQTTSTMGFDRSALIHTHPGPGDISFSGSHIMIKNGEATLAGRAGTVDGDLYVAWREGLSSYVSLPSGAIDHFDYGAYSQNYDPSGTLLSNYVWRIRD